MAKSKTYRELLGQLKLIETVCPELLDNCFVLQSYNWDTAETRYLHIEQMEVNTNPDNPSILLKRTDY